jgi:sugar O-acyltransferase (sialic acid O-acetyltransferase NeuD family)
MKKVLIFGSGPHGRMTAETVSELGLEAVFLTSRKEEVGLIVDGVPIVHVDDASRESGTFIVAIGDPRTRLRWSVNLRERGLRPAQALVHPTAYVSRRAILGEGTVVLPKAVIENGVRIGRDCLINSGAYISHDAVLDAGVSVSPLAQVAGRSRIGRGVLLGMGAVVGSRVTVGDSCLVGMRALVMRDLPPETLVFDMPSEHRGNVNEDNWGRAF